MSNHKYNSAVTITGRDERIIWQGNVHNEPRFIGESGKIIQLFDADSDTTWTLLLQDGDTVKVVDLL